MAERKFKDGDIVRLAPTVLEKYRGEGIIQYVGTIDRYDEGFRCYLVRDIVGFFNVWEPHPDRNRIVTRITPLRLSTKGEVSLSGRAQEMEIETSEDILSMYNSDNLENLRGNYIAEGTFTGGDVRLYPVTTAKVEPYHINRENYFNIRIGSRTVDNVIGCFIQKKIDNVMELWRYNGGSNYRTNIVFTQPYIVVRKEDIQFVIDWKERHQDFLVQGEVL